MTSKELLIECKKGLDIPLSTNAFDGTLTQKILTVKSFMKRAGVPEQIMNEDIDDLAVGVIVMGVGDLWELKSGEVRFSPAFITLLTQLTY
ncbi:MAG: hypothetical protein K0R18_566 [Bacillales bacterium]|jgi:hypothetical protein|nr:hypothetical protein [Bacillales bacterium]